MKKIAGIFVLSVGMLTVSSAFAESSQNSKNEGRSTDLLTSIEAHVNAQCSCAGTPEACCNACPETCKSLHSLGLSMITDKTGGSLKVIPLENND